MAWIDDHPDPVGATVYALRKEVDSLFELRAAGKSEELREHLAPIYEAYIDLGDLLWFFRGTLAAAPVRPAAERRVA
jgi:hypothetical protein